MIQKPVRGTKLYYRITRVFLFLSAIPRANSGPSLWIWVGYIRLRSPTRNSNIYLRLNIHAAALIRPGLLWCTWCSEPCLPNLEVFRFLTVLLPRNWFWKIPENFSGFCPWCKNFTTSYLGVISRMHCFGQYVYG